MKSISVILPALNEEENLLGTVQDVLWAADLHQIFYEIIIINDGSTDQTGVIADNLSRSNSHIKVIHHTSNLGLGRSVREGYLASNKEYAVWLSADRAMTRNSIANMFSLIGSAEIIISYIANPNFRSAIRQLLSKTYVTLLNRLFSLNLKYYNGANIYKTDLIKSIRTSSHGYVFLAEVLIRVLKTGYSFTDVATFHQPRKGGPSKAFRLNNMVEIASVVLRLFYEIQLCSKQRHFFPSPDK